MVDSHFIFAVFGFYLLNVRAAASIFVVHHKLFEFADTELQVIVMALHHYAY